MNKCPALHFSPISLENTSYYKSKMGCNQRFMLTFTKIISILVLVCVCVIGSQQSLILHHRSKDALNYSKNMYWAMNVTVVFCTTIKAASSHGIYLDLRFSNCTHLLLRTFFSYFFFSPLYLKYWGISVIHFTCSESERIRWWWGGGGREGYVVVLKMRCSCVFDSRSD